MTAYNYQVLRDSLKQYRANHKGIATTAIICQEIGISQPTLDNFIRGERMPHQNTVDLVTVFLEKRNAIGLDNFAPPPPREKTPEERIAKALEGIERLLDIHFNG